MTLADAFARGASGEPDPVAEAMRPRGCTSCGLTFGSSAAYQIHFESGEGSRCLPAWRLEGQLTDVGGVLCVPGSDAARK
jgi:hypothetical protein